MARVNIFKKAAASFLIAVMLAVPALQAKAFSMNDLGAVAGTAVSCLVGNLIQKGLTKLGSVATSGAVDILTSINILGFGANHAGQQTLDQVNPKPVKDATTNAATKQTATKLNCLNAIAKKAAQIAIKGLTQYTINWINNGFQNGGPLFVTNQGSFLEAIVDQDVKTFINEIAYDVKNYPFGRDIARTIMSGSSYDPNVYTLDEVIAKATGVPLYTAADYERDFSNGGWDAFEAQLMPQNNPIGFKNLVEGELHNAVFNNPKVKETQDEIQRNTGFLDTKACADPKGYDPKALADAQKALDEWAGATGGEHVTSYNSTDKNDLETYRTAKETVDDLTCKRWETQTPGSVIANQLEQTLGSPLRQLEIGQDLSASLDAIFSALIQQLTKKGLAALSSGSPTSTSMYSNNGGYASNVSITNGNGGSDDNWLSAYPDFNILTDLPKLIKTQQDYIAVAQEQNEFVKNQLIPVLYHLDYCIPGPNPLFFEEVSNKIANDFSDAQNQNGPDHGKILGIPLEDKETHLKSGIEFKNLLYTVLQNYAKAIAKEYKYSKLPDMARIAGQEFLKIHQYEDGVDENEGVIDNLQATVKRLQGYQERIEALQRLSPPEVTNSGSVSTTADPTYISRTSSYEKDLKSIQDGLKRSAQDLVTDDDVEVAKNTLEDFKETHEMIAQPRNGLLDQCLSQVTTHPENYRQGRRPYKGPEVREQYVNIVIDQSGNVLPSGTRADSTKGYKSLRVLDMSKLPADIRDLPLTPTTKHYGPNTFDPIFDVNGNLSLLNYSFLPDYNYAFGIGWSGLSDTDDPEKIIDVSGVLTDLGGTPDLSRFEEYFDIY